MKILMVNNYFKRSSRNLQDFDAFVQTIRQVRVLGQSVDLPARKF